jgi:hypothetical protein
MKQKIETVGMLVDTILELAQEEQFAAIPIVGKQLKLAVSALREEEVLLEKELSELYTIREEYERMPNTKTEINKDA